VYGVAADAHLGRRNAGPSVSALRRHASVAAVQIERGDLGRLLVGLRQDKSPRHLRFVGGRIVGRDPARSEGHGVVEAVTRGGHAMSLALALAQGACPVSVLAGDFAASDRFVALLFRHTTIMR
jgi:hypothetical protein